MLRSGLIGAALLSGATGLHAQSITDRLDRRVPPAIAALVQELGTAALSRGLPADPLIQKAIEGGAKGIPAERVADALRTVARQLDTSATILRGLTPGLADTVAIAAGGFALTAGLNGRHIAELARAVRDENGELPVALRVAGTLAALGVPPDQTVNLVSASLHARRPAAELLTLPSRVQGEMARGVPPAQAAAGLARAAAAQARRGPPAGHGRPPAPPRPHP